MPDIQKMKYERLFAMLANVMQMKSEHLIHITGKSECLIYIRRSLNVSTVMLVNVMHMKSKHLIHMKAKYELLICKRRRLNVYLRC